MGECKDPVAERVGIVALYGSSLLLFAGATQSEITLNICVYNRHLQHSTHDI